MPFGVGQVYRVMLEDMVERVDGKRVNCEAALNVLARRAQGSIREET